MKNSKVTIRKWSNKERLLLIGLMSDSIQIGLVSLVDPNALLIFTKFIKLLSTATADGINNHTEFQSYMVEIHEGTVLLTGSSVFFDMDKLSESDDEFSLTA